MSMITCVTWIPKGAARERPVRYELSREEFSKVKAISSGEASPGKGGGGGDHMELPPEFRMDEYDNEDMGDNDDEEMDEDESGNESDGELDAPREVLDSKKNREDTYEMLETGGIALAMDADSEDEDAEDDEIRATDSLFVIAKTQDEETSHLEVQLLSEEGDLYVHHDIQLPDFPLCLEWLDCPPYTGEDGEGGGQSAVGNYLAVGTFQPAIEIWNLDVMDPLEPTATLGGEIVTQEDIDNEDGSPRKSTGGNGKGKETKIDEGDYLPGSHTHAVLCLSWNKQYRNVLASGSADNSVKIWDVTTQRVQHTFTHHSDKVQSLEWHPSEAWLLATGSYDKTVCLVDCRSTQVIATYKLPADIEAMAWDKGYPYHLYCACEDGQVVCIDIRDMRKVKFTFIAHEMTCTAISFSDKIPGYMTTASVDKTVKAWDTVPVHKGDLSQPLNIAAKSMNAGKLFCMQMYGDSAFTLAAGGDKGMVAVWNSDETTAISTHFDGRGGDRADTLFDYSALSAVAISAAASDGGRGAPAEQGQEEEDDSWMDAPDQSPVKASQQSTSKKKGAANKGKGKGKGKGKK